MKTYAYGYPRLGPNREFKVAVEKYFSGEFSDIQLSKALLERQKHITSMYSVTVDVHPTSEISPYDHFLDEACALGLANPDSLSEYYALARGEKAFPMKKWFNTNYHYLAVSAQDAVNLKSKMPKLLSDIKGSSKELVWMLGPLTIAKLVRRESGLSIENMIGDLTEIYVSRCRDMKSVHMEDPAFVMDLTEKERRAAYRFYKKLGKLVDINLITYYDDVDHLDGLYDLPVKAIGIDFIHGKENIKIIRQKGFPKDKTLIAGIVSGKNVFCSDPKKALPLIELLKKRSKDIMLSNAGPLYHLPETIASENLPQELKGRVLFAREKLIEISQLAKGKRGCLTKLSVCTNGDVAKRVDELKEKDFKKGVAYAVRAVKHKALLKLPQLPTTTIGSFPQTGEIRAMRLSMRRGNTSPEKYREYIHEQIRTNIDKQEKLGLDVLVHGEPERTDMVEYFAEKLEGFFTSDHGWVISYGTRVWRPPIITGDIYRSEPMTIDEIAYAQSLTKKPVKGMLTGPVTILAWSFTREDIPLEKTAYQLALALQDEIRDYENEGIRIVQVDEPAIREKAPVKKKDWKRYFKWASKAFNLATNTSPDTQIHIHMCYSDFTQAMPLLLKLDFDVITIESARSGLDMLKVFKNSKFTRQIGLGVWDIHSPHVPEVSDMVTLLNKCIHIFGIERFWVNPDCGLKTRKWDEVDASLKNMIGAVEQVKAGEKPKELPVWPKK